MNNNIEKAITLFRLSRYSQAIRELKIILASKPDSIDANLILCQCYEKFKQYDLAISQVEHTINIAPKCSAAYYLKAAILLKICFIRHKGNIIPERLKEAEINVNKALEINPYNPDYWCLLGAIGMNQKICLDNFEYKIDIGRVSTCTISSKDRKEINRFLSLKSLRAVENGLEIESDHAGCINIKTIMLFALGYKKEAKHLLEKHQLEKIISDEDRHPFTYTMLGRFAVLEKQYDRAIEYFETAFNLGLDSARLEALEAIKLKYKVYRIISYKTSIGASTILVNFWLCILCIVSIVLTSGKSIFWIKGLLILGAYFILIFLFPTLFEIVLEFKPSEAKFISYRQRRKRKFLLLSIAIFVLSLIVSFQFPEEQSFDTFIGLTITLSQILPIYLTLSCRTKQNKLWMEKYTIFSIILAIVALFTSNFVFESHANCNNTIAINYLICGLIYILGGACTGLSMLSGFCMYLVAYDENKLD